MLTAFAVSCGWASSGALAGGPDDHRRLYLWKDLTAADHYKAYSAARSLAGAGDEAVAFFRGRFKPAAADPARLGKLIRDLDHTQYAVRSKALHDLWTIGSPAEDALRAELQKTRSPEVRSRLKSLLEDLANTPATRRRAAWGVRVLEAIGSGPARKLLGDVAQGDAKASLTVEARTALAHLATKPEITSVPRRPAPTAEPNPKLKRLHAQMGREDWYVRMVTAKELGRIGDVRSVQWLTRPLKGGPWKVSEAAASALGSIGAPAAVGPLTAALSADHPRVRASAAAALGAVGDPRAVEPLIGSLPDPERNVHLEALSALGRIRGIRAVDPLLKMLLCEALRGPAKDEDRIVRSHAVRALARVRDVRALDILIDAMQDSYYRARQAAAEGLGEMSDPRATAALAKAVGDKEEQVRWAAVAPLLRSDDRRAKAALKQVSARDISFARAHDLFRLAERQGAGAVDALLAALTDSDDYVRRSAALALCRIKTPRAQEALLPFLKSPDEAVRSTAAQSLAVEGDQRGFDVLFAALADNDRSRRRNAARRLGDVGDARAVGPLIAAAKTGHRKARQGAMVALGKIGDARAVPVLLEAMKDSHWLVRCYATAALGRIGDARAAKTLAGALDDDHRQVTTTAAWSLVLCGWRPADRNQRVRWLVAAERWDDAAQVAQTAVLSKANKHSAAGRLELGVPILLNMQVTTKSPQGKAVRAAELRWIRFERRDGKLTAKIVLRHSSWPGAKYLVTVELIDAAHRVVGEATASFEASGIILGLPLWRQTVLHFSLGKWDDVSEATGFRVKIKQATTKK